MINTDTLLFDTANRTPQKVSVPRRTFDRMDRHRVLTGNDMINSLVTRTTDATLNVPRIEIGSGGFNRALASLYNELLEELQQNVLAPIANGDPSLQAVVGAGRIALEMAVDAQEKMEYYGQMVVVFKRLLEHIEGDFGQVVRRVRDRLRHRMAAEEVAAARQQFMNIEVSHATYDDSSRLIRHLNDLGQSVTRYIGNMMTQAHFVRGGEVLAGHARMFVEYYHNPTSANEVHPDMHRIIGHVLMNVDSDRSHLTRPGRDLLQTVANETIDQLKEKGWRQLGGNLDVRFPRLVANATEAESLINEKVQECAVILTDHAQRVEGNIQEDHIDASGFVSSGEVSAAMRELDLDDIERMLRGEEEATTDE